MLNLNSDTDLHFFLCGVSKFGKNEKGDRELGEMNGALLYHNARATYSFVEFFEHAIPGWSYSLGFDLVLIDVRENNNQRELGFSSAVYFKVEELIKLKIIERPSELLSKLVKFVREGKVTNATEFRVELTSIFGKDWLKGLILVMFPKHVGKLARAGAVLIGGSATTD